MIWSARKYRLGLKKHWLIYGPFYLTLLSGMLVIMDPLRHILVDANVWSGPSGSEYRNGCNEETMRCFTLTGWFITFGCTYVGFILLFIATIWNANLGPKIKKLYQQCVLVCKQNGSRKERNLQDP